MNKLLILFFFIFAYTENILCTENDTDDIFTIKKSSQDIKELTKIHSKIKNSDSTLHTIDLLEKRAIEQNNVLYTTLAYKEKAYFYSKQSQTDSIKTYLNKISENLDILYKSNNLSEADKKEVEAIRIFATTTKYYIYINENKYDIVLIEVNKILESSKKNRTPLLEAESYTLLGTGYLYTKNMPEAIKCFRKALEINIQLMAKQPPNNYNFYKPMEGLSIAYGGSKKYKEALQISDSLLSRIDETYQYIKYSDSETADDRFIYKYHKSRASCYDALWNIKTNNTKKARVQLDSISHFIKQHYGDSITSSDFGIYEYVESNYWFAARDLKKAKEYAISMTKINLADNTFTYMLTHLQLAKILNAEGNCNEAYTLMDKLFWQNDSINATNFSEQVAEMQTQYQVDKAQMAALQSEKKLTKAKYVLFIAFFIIIISFAIAFSSWQNRKKIIKKNIQLYNQYIEIKNRNKEIASLQRGLLTEQDLTSEYIDSNNLLIQRLNEYLQETKCFLNPELTREELAIHIGTNRQYLIQAIKENTGKTFNEYIYSFRLEYAHEQIINDRKKPISEILLEAGFLTRTTFYKSFKETYGLTPNELRRILN